MNLFRKPAEETLEPTALPRVDVYESQDEILLVVDLAGVPQDAVEVQFGKGELTLSGKRTPAPKGTPLHTEFRPLPYRRVFSVPSTVDASKIEAKFDHGVLSVHLPKVDAHKPKRISVQVG